jgi:hypothetical protein
MPRASTYRDAAQHFRRTSARLADLAFDNRSLGSAGIGAVGPVAERHDVNLAAAELDVAAVADELLRLAELCEQRAQVCDEYARRLADYWTAPFTERFESAPPAPPAAWVSA